MTTRLPVSLVLALIAGCGSASSEQPRTNHSEAPRATTATREEAVPTGQLGTNVTPAHYALDLRIVPSEPGFTGDVRIDVAIAEPTTTVYLHALHIDVARVAATQGERTLVGRFEQTDVEGVAALRFDAPLEAGDAQIELSFAAEFGHSLEGLYRVDQGQDSYAFTQFEAISARQAFPCFDEPRFKTPFDVTLTVRADDVAAANTSVVSEAATSNGERRVTYAPTLPLPTYLLAWAVGPLDVVEAPPIAPSAVRSRPLPFRGIAARGQGPKLAYAMEQTPRILAELERYFGIEYPYDKLDIVAVPDFASGAMENAGLVTFREWLLLIDPDNAGEQQRRALTSVVAHELAHQWFGDLVTMRWWDDIWLNEAFATWMASKTIRALYPEHEAELGVLLGVHGAMNDDSLANARQIRQPITSNHDIANAFDSITYQKGGGVLEMFERYMGVEPFRTGVQHYLAAHRFGNATSDDLLASLSEAAGRDIGTPFRTFIEQSGVPNVAMEVVCEGESAKLRMRQSRYLPLGSTATAQRTWQIPVCVSYDAGGTELAEQCTILDHETGELALESDTCPRFLVPNSDAAGYFRYSLDAESLAHLRANYARLRPRERISLANNLRAAVAAGTMPIADQLDWAQVFARDEERTVAMAPAQVVRFVHDQIGGDLRAKAEEHARTLYGRQARRLGYAPRAGEDAETHLMRRDVLDFLSDMNDPAVRRELARRATQYLAGHEDAVSPDLLPIALRVLAQDDSARAFPMLLERFVASNDSTMRPMLLAALSSVRDPALATQALDLVLDRRLRENEFMTPLFVQADMIETQEAALAWLFAHWDPLLARLTPLRAGRTVWVAAAFCDDHTAEQINAFFAPHIEALEGGPRNLANALEVTHLCAARVEAQRESAQSFYTR